MGALSYAELAAMMPHAGGQYVYLREAFGSLWAFLYGWTFFLVIQTGFIAAVSVAFAKFLGVLAPRLGTGLEGEILWSKTDFVVYRYLPVPWLKEDEWPLFFQCDYLAITRGQFVAVGVTVVLTAINCFGVQLGKLVQNVFTVVKLLSLATLIVLGLTVALNTETLSANFTNIWDGIWTTDQFFNVSKIAPAGLAVAMVIGGAMVGSLFSADSWNNVTFTAGETRDPKRNLPRSLVLGTTMVIGLYVLANVAYLAALPIQGDKKQVEAKTAVIERAKKAANVDLFRLKLDIDEWEVNIASDLKKIDHLTKLAALAAKANKADEVKNLEKQIMIDRALVEKLKQLLATKKSTLDWATKDMSKLEEELITAGGISLAKDDRVGTAVLERVSPTLGVTFMAIAIMISTFGCVNGLVLAGPRLYYAMAKDGLFFRAVGHLNARGTPVAGLVLQGLWSIVLIFSGTYNDLLAYIIFAALLFYVLTVAGLFVLRRTQPNAERPYRAVGYPVVPALYIALCTFIMLDLLVVKPVYSWPSFIIVLAGIPVFFLWRVMGTSQES